MPDLWAKMEVQFNDHNATVVGRIIDCSNPNHFLVDFEHDNVQFRGLWNKNECVLVDEPIVPKVGDVWRTKSGNITWIVRSYNPNDELSMLWFDREISEWVTIPVVNQLETKIASDVTLAHFAAIFAEETNLVLTK